MLKRIIFTILLVVPLSVFAQNFGHIRSQEILTAMPEYEKAQTDIETMKKQYDDELKRFENDFTKKYTEFQQEQANLPKNILERRQKDLDDLYKKGIELQQDSEQQLRQSWMQMIEPIAKKVDDAIKAVGQEGGYVYIFDLNSINIPYVSETLSTDVTAAVKSKLGIQ